MFKIDTAGNIANQFTNGNPGTGVPATVVSDEWLNAVQNEIAYAITMGGGLTLVKADSTQLLAALNAMINKVPTLLKVGSGVGGAPAYASGWTRSVSGGNGASYFYKQADGTVHVVVTAEGSTLTARAGSGTIFTLPAGYRPYAGTASGQAFVGTGIAATAYQPVQFFVDSAGALTASTLSGTCTFAVVAGVFSFHPSATP